MAALPPSNTERWYLSYSVGTFVHTITMRTQTGITLATVQAAFDAFMTALNPVLFLATTIGLNRSNVGSNVRLPQDLGPLAGTYGNLVPSPRNSVYGLAFPGRSVEGHKTRVYVIGTNLQGDDNYRYTATENANINNAVIALNSGAGAFWLGIDGNEANWYPYATSKQNDHFIGELRGT